MNPTSDYYRAAIAALQTYAFSEPDAAKRAEAFAQIRRHQYAIQDAAFDGIAGRTPKLELLVADLKTVIQGSSDPVSCGAAIKELETLAAQVAGVVKLISS